jgi:cytochrome c-type biogenesis protein
VDDGNGQRSSSGSTGVIEEDSITIVSYGIALGGGLISFASPCVLPVVPGYLSLITGLDISELEASKKVELGSRDS